MSEGEKVLKDETPRGEYLDLTEMIFKDQRSFDFNLIDLTRALDAKSSKEQFYYDWCHLGYKGNAVIASALLEKLKLN